MSVHIRCRPAKPRWRMSYEYHGGANMLFCRTKYYYHNNFNVVRGEIRTFQLMSYKKHASNGLQRRSPRGVRGARQQHLQTSDQQADRKARQSGQCCDRCDLNPIGPLDALRKHQEKSCNWLSTWVLRRKQEITATIATIVEHYAMRFINKSVPYQHTRDNLVVQTHEKHADQSTGLHGLHLLLTFSSKIRVLYELLGICASAQSVENLSYTGAFASHLPAMKPISGLIG
ncbi:hypothetical protein IG631_22039 [Alternaria alternata]|nr:hypothetical protein IG631_22039 [Alternaria alternata]